MRDFLDYIRETWWAYILIVVLVAILLVLYGVVAGESRPGNCIP